MKNFNIVLVTVFTLISTVAMAQTNNNLSKKEQMKMEVVKINATPTKISNNVTAINRSAKEQMKIDLIKSPSTEQPHELVVGNQETCSNQLPNLHLSPKEQMKLKVMKQNLCTVVASDTGMVKDGKCNMCGKNISDAKK